MTKAEALEAMKAGRKLTHISFCGSEWVARLSAGLYEFEDGCVCRPQEFWRGRTGDSWQSGWSIFQ